MHRRQILLLFLIVLPVTIILVVISELSVSATGDWPDERSLTKTMVPAKPSFSEGQPSQNTEPQAAVTFVSTRTVMSYIPAQQYQYLLEIEYQGALPSLFTYEFTGFTQTNLSLIEFYWDGPGVCVQEDNLDIICRDTRHLHISFIYSTVVSPTSRYVTLSEGSWSDFPVDATINFIYPASLVYVSAQVEPTLHEDNLLRWQKSSSIGYFDLYPTFLDMTTPFDKSIYLPALHRN